MTSDGSLLLRGTRLVIPRSLQLRVMKVSHAGHLGLVKTKQLIREKVWFPGVDKLASDLITKQLCLPSSHVNHTTCHHYRMDIGWKSELMSKTCPTVSISSLSLIITDDYLRYPIVEIITSTAAKVVSPVIDKVFAEFGVPHILKCDNGSPIQSDDFAKFANYIGFKQRRITPYWPRANAECERFMKTLGKCIKAATGEGRSYKQHLHALCDATSNY